MFTRNIGRADRKFRLMFGTALVILASIADMLGIIPRLLGFACVIAGILMIGTGLLGFCGVYKIIGKNTFCAVKKED